MAKGTYKLCPKCDKKVVLGSDCEDCGASVD